MKFVFGCAFLFFSGHMAIGQLSLPPIFSNNMVLQRDAPIHFWGKGVPNMAVEIRFAGEMKHTEIHTDSTWSIFLKKRKSDAKPQSIEINSGTENIRLSNILIGDVWLCLGQSNMEWPMKKEMHFKEELNNIEQPSLRFYNPSYAGKNIYNERFTDSVLQLLNNKAFYKGIWAISDSTTIKQMSAVGYYFGQQIVESEHMPVGLINLAIGGAPIETFIDRRSLKGNTAFSRKVRGNWLTNVALPVWVRERGRQNVGNISMAHQDDLGPNHAFKPGFAYSAGIAPLLQMPIKGILWYQGESNAQEPKRVDEYAALQKLMIKDYRNQWKEPELPFYWVQLSSIDTIKYKSHFWPEFRNEQRKLLDEIEHGGMAVSSDIGSKNDVHPINKKDIGIRLARWALNKTYGRKVVPSGPLPKKATFKNGKVVVDFKFAAHGLKTVSDKKVQGFSVNGKHDVSATLNGDTVEISLQEKPEYIYYGWQPYSKGNLINAAGLPMSTFKIRVR